MQPDTPIRDEDLKFFRITQIAYVIGAVSHGLAVGLFWSLGVREMMWFNALISVPFFLIALFINRRGHHSIAFSLAFFELFVHQVLGTYYIGWGFGLQYWLIYLGGLSFFNPLWNRYGRFWMLALVSAGLVGLFFFAQEGVYDLSPDFLRFSTAQNLVIVIVLLALLINYYARLAYEAEQKLKDEKAITEQQNIQLTNQHEALVIEQDKTARMLGKIQSLFGQQVSQEVARELIQSPSEIDSKTFDLTVMFLDIRVNSLYPKACIAQWSLSVQWRIWAM